MIFAGDFSDVILTQYLSNGLNCFLELSRSRFSMSSVHNNSVETVNAAASAIVTAETRVQPSTVQVLLFLLSVSTSLSFFIFGFKSAYL